MDYAEVILNAGSPATCTFVQARRCKRIDMGRIRDQRKHKFSVVNRVPVVLKGTMVDAGTSFKLRSVQVERNADIMIWHAGSWMVVDPVDYVIPPEATAHLSPGKSIYAQGLEKTESPR